MKAPLFFGVVLLTVQVPWMCGLSISISTKNGEDKVPLPPTETSNTRGLFSDFYGEQTKTVASSSISTVSHFGDLNESPDFGEKFTQGVVHTAVAFADAGIQTAQDILKTVGSEIIEAIRS